MERINVKVSGYIVQVYGIKAIFYCATIAYHVELNADLGRPQVPAIVQER